MGIGFGGGGVEESGAKSGARSRLQTGGGRDLGGTHPSTETS